MAKRNNGIKRELSRYIRKLNAPIPVSKVMAQVKAEYPELLYGVETKKEKREAMKNFYEVKTQKINSKYSKWTFWLILVGALIALAGFLSQQATILPNNQFVCPYYQNFNLNTETVNGVQMTSGGEETTNFTFSNAGGGLGYVGIQLANTSVFLTSSVYQLPHEYAVASGSSMSIDLWEYLPQVIPHAYNFSIKTITYDGIGLLSFRTACYIKTCNYESYYNSSSPAYNTNSDKLFFHVINYNMNWSSC